MLIKAEEIPTINLSSPLKSGEGDGYTIEEDSICIKTYSNRYVNNIFGSYFYIYTDNRFILTGTNVDKTIIMRDSLSYDNSEVIVSIIILLLIK